MYETIKGVISIKVNGTEFYKIEDGEVINQYRPGTISDVTIHNSVAFPTGETKSRDGFKVSLLGYDVPSEAFDIHKQMASNARMSICEWGFYRFQFEANSWISEELCDICLNNDDGDEAHVYEHDVEDEPCLIVTDCDHLYLEALKWKLFYLGIKDMSVFTEHPDIVLNEEDVKLIEKHQEALGNGFMQPVYVKANEVFGTHFKTN